MKNKAFFTGAPNGPSMRPLGAQEGSVRWPEEKSERAYILQIHSFVTENF
jgi:hypothetical protein